MSAADDDSSGWPTWLAADMAGMPAPRTTGRLLVVLREEPSARQAALRFLHNKAGLKHVAHAAGDYTRALSVADADAGDGMIFESLNVAVIKPAPDARRAVVAGTGPDSPMAIVEPELFMMALGDNPATQDWPWIWSVDPQHDRIRSSQSGDSLTYLRGFRDAVNTLFDQLAGGDLAAHHRPLMRSTESFDDSAEGTWGLKAIGVLQARATGKGVRVAVLDTGIDLEHPDFASRQIESQSFVPGESVQDGHGHGTHCIGTACGSLSPTSGPRYGVATGTTILAGKVLSDRGSGPDRGILAGIDWALRNGCHVVSMSLGVPAPVSRVYDEVGRRTLRRGTLIVAAAGNDSRRSMDRLAPVSRPANSDSIMAVAAVDQSLRVADFSNVSAESRAGQVDIAGPGVDVFSSFPMPQTTRRLSGTSMAAPHVAGIAALYAEAIVQRDAFRVWSLVTARCRRLDAPNRDVGAGLVQAPRATDT